MELGIHSTCPIDPQFSPVKISIQKNEGRSLTIEIETVRLRILSVNDDQYTASLVELYGNKKVNQLVGSGTTS